MGYSIRNGYLHYEYTEEDRQSDEVWNSLTKKGGKILKGVAIASASLLLYYHAALKPVWNYVQNTKIESSIERTISPEDNKAGIEEKLNEAIKK